MWDGPTFQSYYIHIPQDVRAFLDGEDPSYLLTVDFEEYLDYLVDRYEWQTQEWDADAKTIEPITEKIQTRFLLTHNASIILGLVLLRPGEHSLISSSMAMY